MIVLFDVMDTLVQDPFHEVMPTFFGMSLHELLEVKHPSAWVELELGRRSPQSFLDDFFADGRSYDQEGFVRAVQDAYAWVDGMEGLLQELKQRQVPMHALSNYPVWYEWIELRLGLSRYIDWTFVSCRTGVRKPDPAAFTGAAAALGISPSECVFVDDRASNVRAASEAGLRALRFENAPALRQNFVDLGIL